MALQSCLEKWFSKCFSKAVTGLSHKVAIFGVYNVFGSGWILITFSAVRLNTQGAMMWKTFSIIVYVALRCLLKLNLTDVLEWHWFIGGDL